MRFATVAVLIAAPTSAFAADSGWRTYAGGFSTRWQTRGPHGHDQAPCGYPWFEYFDDGKVIAEHGVDCNPTDFSRANLDNSIGFRLGAERDVLAVGPLRFVGGFDGSVSHTEYNQTQMDIAIFNASLLAGADIDLWGARAGMRFAAGPFTSTDAMTGLTAYRELSLTLPVRGGAAFRISRRQDTSERIRRKERVRATETAFMIVASPDASEPSRWDYSVTTGTTTPGKGPGGSLELHEAAWQRVAVMRDLKSPSTQLAFAWTSTAHESRLFSDYKGYTGNQRGKTINGFSFGLQHAVEATQNLSARYGAGFEVADWRDPYPLLVSRNLQPLRGGIEMAVTASGALRYRLRRGLSFEATVQQLYWHDLQLGESRWGAGIVITR